MVKDRQMSRPPVIIGSKEHIPRCSTKSEYCTSYTVRCTRTVETIVDAAHMRINEHSIEYLTCGVYDLHYVEVDERHFGQRNMPWYTVNKDTRR